MIKNLSEHTKRRYIIISISNEIGISKTAELFNLSRTTIHDWKKRYKENGFEGLQNKSRENQNSKNKMPENVVKKIFKLKAKNPKISAKMIKDTLNLNQSLSTIYYKLQNFDQSISNFEKKVAFGIPKKKSVFKDFFVSIKKIQYKRNLKNNLPKYIILLEEKYTSIVFSSFSYERTSISIAIFLEYFIESIKQVNLGSNYNFYLSGAIKISSNDPIIQIIRDKFQYNLILNVYSAQFHSSSQIINPYKLLYMDLFSEFNEASKQSEENI